MSEAVTINTNTNTTSTAETAPPSRPDHIPEKFWDAEKGAVRVDDLAKSYGELEKKFGGQAKPGIQQQQEQPQTAETPAADKAAADALQAQGFDYGKLQEEYVANDGKLTAETYAELAKKGFTEEMVDDHIDAVNARNALARQNAFTEAGIDEAKFGDIVEWAKTGGLTKAEIEAYNRQTTGTPLAEQTAALKNLVARYEQANGSEPSLQNAKGTAPSADVYRDFSEMQRDMADPRYEQSQAFRDEVAAKLARSSIM